MRFLFCFFFFVSILSYSQRQEAIDVKSGFVFIKRIKEGQLGANVNYQFDILKDVDSIFLDAKNMAFNKVYLGRKPFTYKYYDDKLRVFYPFKKDSSYSLLLNYAAFPKQTVYFIKGKSPEKPKILSNVIPTDKIEYKRFNNPITQIWTQGQGKYTSHWLPSFDDMNEKIELSLAIRVKNQQTVIANGKLVKVDSINKFRQNWIFDMTQPMSSYLAAFVIGNFDKKVIQSKSGVPIELYYEPKDSLKVEPTYRYSKQIFDFLEEEIGVTYPWQNYKQVPVQDFLYAGMENTTCTIFSNQFVIDSTAFIDKNYVNVNAHELAHQWFGNLVTEVSGEHHWLHEGFATYYAYLAEKELFGDDHFCWKLYQTANTLHNLSENEGGEALTNPNANSLTFYEKGAWALVALKERIGNPAFAKGIQNYLNKHAYANVTIPDFILEMENASEKDLTSFVDQWLNSEEFLWEEAKEILTKRSTSLKTYFDLKEDSNKENINPKILSTLWSKSTSDELKIALIKDYGHMLLNEDFLGQLQNEPIKVRQALVQRVDSIPKAYQNDFEQFLEDRSYVTREMILFKLWQAFPESRSKYLNELSNSIGLPNKNVRLLWLTLALITEDYEPENKSVFYEELNGYTAPEYNFEVRQLAFQYLNQIQALSDKSLIYLIEALNHHVWQFKKSSRNLLRSIYRNTVGKKRLDAIKENLSESENELLEGILK